MLQASTPDTFLRHRDVCRLTGLGRTKIYEMIGAGEFPRPYKLTERVVGWRESEIVRWQNTRVVAEPERKTKRCAGCGEDKAAAKFHPHATTPDRLSPRCKSCVRAGKRVPAATAAA